jgi:hypothetical protein
MITSRDNLPLQSLPVNWHEPFLAMLPQIQRYLRFSKFSCGNWCPSPT